MDLLRSKRILLVHGTGFNWPEPDHFRIVTLPDKETLAEALGRLKDFLTTYVQNKKKTVRLDVCAHRQIEASIAAHRCAALFAAYNLSIGAQRRA
jgi:hypothetical protein